MTHATQTTSVIDDLVAANHILAHEDVADAFGHVSARHPARADRYLIARATPPENVTAADVMEIAFDGEVADGDARKPYLERHIHGAIYEARPDVASVIHTHSHGVIPFGTSQERLRPLVHSCATIGSHIPVWDAQTTFGDTNLLVSSMTMGRDLASALAQDNVVLMRGHGCTVIGRSIREAVYTAIYLNVNADLQIKASRLSPLTFLTDGEIDAICKRLADAQPGEGYDRAWEYWHRRAEHLGREEAARTDRASAA